MLRIVLTAVLLATAPALASAQSMTMDHGRAGHTPAAKAYAAAMDRMMHSMGAKPTGDPDRDFVTMMLPHHQGAIDMAEVEIRYGKDPKLLEMARAIVAAQQKEIAEMRSWQASHPR